MEKADLIAFVSKLNDRGLQKQRSNGISLWAILTAFGLVFLDLARSLDELLKSSVSLDWTVVIQTITVDFVAAIMIVVVGLLTVAGAGGSRRLATAIGTKSGVLVKTPLRLILLFLIAVNVASAISSSGHCIVLIVNISAALVFVGMFFFDVWESRTNADKPDPVLPSEAQRKKVSKVYIWFAIGFMLSLVLSVLNVWSSVSEVASSSQVLRRIVFGVELFALLLLALMLFIVLQRRHRNLWLEDLEKDIYLDDFDKETIEERLEEYLGQPVVRWMIRKGNEVERQGRSFASACIRLSTEFDEMLSVAGDASVNRQQAKERLCREVEKVLTAVKTHRDKVCEGIVSIARKGVLESDEGEAERKLRKKLFTARDEVSSSARDICTKCKEKTSSGPCKDTINTLLSEL